MFSLDETHSQLWSWSGILQVINLNVQIITRCNQMDVCLTYHYFQGNYWLFRFHTVRFLFISLFFISKFQKILHCVRRILLRDRGPIDIENLTIDNFKCFTNLTTWSNNFLYLIILLFYFQVSNSILLDYIAGDPTNYPLTKFAFGLNWKTLHQFSEMDGGARIIFNLI